MAAQGVLYSEYYLLGRLAMGGMAEVFLARSLLPGQNNRLLALKRTLPQLAAEVEFLQMFTDEARIAHGLKHPNICEIIDQGEFDDQLFIVMEFLHGKDLKVVQQRAKQRNEAIPPRHSAFILQKMAEALDYAHRHANSRGEPEGIVHRDVSPQNILILYDGVPKLIDFGIAKAKDRIAKTRVGVVKGKFAYMSPEQAIGKEVDRRTDIFALGVVLYELLTGQLPFRGSSDFSTLKKIAKAEYVPPLQLAPDIPPQLVAIVEKALARDPANRYQWASDLAEALETFLEEGKEVNPGSISAFMRRLFRDDYVREMARIKEFLEIAPPGDASAQAQASYKKRMEAQTTSRGRVNAPAPKKRDDSPFIEINEEQEPPREEATVVAATLDLAAGYDREKEEITGLNELLTGDGLPGTDASFIEDTKEHAIDGAIGDDDTTSVRPASALVVQNSPSRRDTDNAPFKDDTRAQTIVLEDESGDSGDDGADEEELEGFDVDVSLTGVRQNPVAEPAPTPPPPEARRRPTPAPAPAPTPAAPSTGPRRTRTLEPSPPEPSPAGDGPPEPLGHRPLTDKRPAPSAKRKTRTASRPQPKRRKRLLSGGEIVLLAVVLILCAAAVAATAYVSVNGMPPALAEIFGGRTPAPPSPIPVTPLTAPQ